MKQRKKVEWSRLDNASKIFPATCNEKDTKVFRLSCELYEKVEPDILQKSLDITLEDFPLYKSVLRRGVFWYYFEISDIKLKVEEEALPICAPIYNMERRNLLFRVLYFNNRISVEIFHALSDGTGAIWFLKTLAYHYLSIKHSGFFKGKYPKLNYDASISEKMDDSFGRYFGGRIPGKNDSITNGCDVHAHRIKGVSQDENRMKVIEGSMSAKAVLAYAHEYNTTLTIFISSLFIYSIYNSMKAQEKIYPVILSVPINLRQYFKSETARNFFSTMNIGYSVDKTNDIKDIVVKIGEEFKTALTEERLVKQLNKFMKLELNPFARVAPLPVKDFTLRLVNRIKDRGITAAISNLGRISMPPEFDDFISQISIFTSARRPQICICSYKDRLVITFTSPFRETDIQRTFFEFLSRKGIEIEISSNL
jgi:NRPS condensation-like uncharacterized protein